MEAYEVLIAFKLIVSGQVNDYWVLDFILTCENIPHSAVFISDDDGDDEIQELPDPPRVSPLNRRKSLVSFLE